MYFKQMIDAAKLANGTKLGETGIQFVAAGGDPSNLLHFWRKRLNQIAAPLHAEHKWQKVDSSFWLCHCKAQLIISALEWRSVMQYFSYFLIEWEISHFRAELQPIAGPVCTLALKRRLDPA